MQFFLSRKFRSTKTDVKPFLGGTFLQIVSTKREIRWRYSCINDDQERQKELSQTKNHKNYDLSVSNSLDFFVGKVLLKPFFFCFKPLNSKQKFLVGYFVRHCLYGTVGNNEEMGHTYDITSRRTKLVGSYQKNLKETTKLLRKNKQRA